MSRHGDNKDNIGIFFALLTATVSGVAIFYSKNTIVKFDPLILTSARNLYVALIFFISLSTSKRIREIKRLGKKELTHLLLIGLIGGALPFYLFFSGLQFVQAGVANLIHKTLFIWVSILAIIFLKEKFKFSYLLGFLLIVFGTSYFTSSRPSLGKGELMILTATLLWAI